MRIRYQPGCYAAFAGMQRPRAQIFRELLTYMLNNPATIEPALDLIQISRHLERIGDHATNVAEDVIFILSARDVRHHGADPSRAVGDV